MSHTGPDVATPEAAKVSTPRRWLPAPTTPGRRALRLAAWLTPLVLAWLLQLPVCPYAIALREPCPGCGMTRAAEAIAHLDVTRALAMNPLALAVVPAAAWLAFEGAALYVFRGRTKLNEPIRMVVGITLCVALTVVWLLRRYLGAFGGPIQL